MQNARETMTNTDTIDRIRERAYAIWQSEGCPEGCAEKHWSAPRRSSAIPTRPPIATPVSCHSPTPRMPRCRPMPMATQRRNRPRSGGSDPE